MSKRSKPIIAIDGPAGSGKSTIAKLLAKRLHFTHINTGAIYRGVAYLAMQAGVNLAEENAVARASQGVAFSFQQTATGNDLHINGKNVAELIRDEAVGAAASLVSAYPSVRAMLLQFQRDLGKMGGAVLEGRDIATVVFPDAEVKLFLTASIEERAKRRAKELAEKGELANISQIQSEMIQRDKQDSTRAIAPLKKALDAIEVDTTGFTIESVLDQLESIIKKA